MQTCCAGRMAPWVVLFALVALGFTFSSSFSNLLALDEPQDARFFEMRTYVAPEGKLDDLLKRFRDHTTKLFEKHGMTNIGYWIPTDGDESKNTLVYLLAYPSREAREESWKAFLADPEWKAAQAESEKNGKLVAKVIAQYLKATDFSAIK